MEEVERSNIPLGDRIKQYEAVFTGPRIDPTKPFVIRLDGHSFSRFTRGLKQPYDYNFHQAMVNTTKALMEEYDAQTGYTHSDEISLLFYPRETKTGETREPHFGGRIQKIVSTSAGFCTMTFNKELANMFAGKEDEYPAEKSSVFERMTGFQSYFDSRMFQVPDEGQMFSYMFWRSSIDCRRNHVSELSRRHFTKGELDKKSTNERISMLAEKGVIWEDQPACFRRGSYFKKLRRPMEDPEKIRFDFVEIDINPLTKFDDEINTVLSCDVHK
jgi:tRNA(His) guanylyltransferase